VFSGFVIAVPGQSRNIKSRASRRNNQAFSRHSLAVIDKKTALSLSTEDKFMPVVLSADLLLRKNHHGEKLVGHAAVLVPVNEAKGMVLWLSGKRKNLGVCR
jgi:hypothetical protein